MEDDPLTNGGSDW